MKSKIFVSARQMREIDRVTSEKYKISSLILMENAGRAAACGLERSVKNLRKKKIAVVCGSGNNAGDGFVAARYLFNGGFNVKVIMTKPASSFKGDCLTNFEILKKIKVPLSKKLKDISAAAVIVDAVLGTGINGSVSGLAQKAVKMINDSKTYVLSIDIPSGLGSDLLSETGEIVKADKTITLALMKNVFKYKKAAKYTGKIEVADIGIPKPAIRDILK